MKQDETKSKVLAQLQEYAQLYFEAIIETNTKDGKCDLRPGKYSANELTDNSYKSALGCAWELPCDTMFDEELIIEAGTFQCSFPFRRIFEILAKWETMMRAGKQKAVFEVGEVEIVSAKVLTDNKTELGAYKEKRVKLQRLHCNWYAPARIKRGARNVYIYYKHDNVFFRIGQMRADMLDDKNRELLIMQLDEEESCLTKSLLRLAMNDEYFAEVCKRMDIEAQQPATTTGTPQIPTGAAETVKCTAEVENKPKYHYHELKRKIEIVSVAAKYAEWIVGAEIGPDGLYFKIERDNNTYWLTKSELREKLQAQNIIESHAATVIAESETTQDAAYMQPYNIKYYAERFGNWQNFNKCYEDAMEAVRWELFEYDCNRRKGGSYRRRKIDALKKRLDALFSEWSRLTTLLAKYWQTSPQITVAPQSPEIPPKPCHPDTKAPPEATKTAKSATWRHRRHAP